MRTMKKLIAVCLSCVLLGTAGVQAVEVSSTEKSMQAEELLKDCPTKGMKNAYSDSRYGYVSYRWKGNGRCIRYTLKDGKIHEKEITLRGKTKKYAKKRDYYSCDWMDTNGNFYFQTSESHKKKDTVKETKYLNKVNKKGKLLKRIKLNDWLKIDNGTIDPYNGYYSGSYEAKNHYELFIERIEGNEVVASYSDGKKSGYVILDRNTGKVKRQIITYEEKKRKSTKEEVPDGERLCNSLYHKQILFSISRNGKLFYEKVTTGKKITLPSGNKIKYQKFKKQKQICQLPGNIEVGGAKRIFSAKKNHVYLLAPEGYYRIDVKDLSLEKLASTSEVPFWKNEYSDIEFSDLVILSKKECLFGLYNYTNEPDEHVKLLLWQGTIP